MDIINYKDFDLNELNLTKINDIISFKYRDKFFFIRTCFLTFNTPILLENGVYYIDFLINNIVNNQRYIFLNKMIELNNKIKELYNINILKTDNNFFKIRFNLLQNNSNISTKVYYENDYISNYNKYIIPNNTASLIIILDNIDINNNIINFEIIEMHINKNVITSKNDSNSSYENTGHINNEQLLNNEIKELNDLLNDSDSI